MHPDQEHIRGEAYTVGAKKKFIAIESTLTATILRP